VIRSFDNLGPDAAGQIAEHRRRKEFLWVDLTVSGSLESTLAEVQKVLGVSADVLAALGDFDPNHALARKFYADDERVAFPFHWVPPRGSAVASPDPRQVNFLVHGDYLLTLHRDACEPLDRLRAKRPVTKRSEQYVVYLALDELTNTIFEALGEIEDSMALLETELAEAKGRGGRKQRGQIMLATRQGLTDLRRTVGPQRAIFERVAEEVSQLEGLEGDRSAYFERIFSQLDHVVKGIDAVSQALSSSVELGLNETIYRLTVIATIFLPLTFVTGFFGMNFGWMVEEVDSLAAFLVFGLGTLVLAGLAILYVVDRQSALPPPGGSGDD